MASFDEHSIDATVEQTARSALQVSSGTLLVEQGPDAGKKVRLAGERLVVGRAQGNGLVLTDPAVSATHFEVTPGPDGPLLRDLGSTNGVLLAGHRVERFTLHAGSVFSVGGTTLRFTLSGERVPLPISPMEEFGELFGKSVAMRRVFAQLERAAPLDLTVLLTGETGTGKELAARSIHQMSLRADRPFLVLDCGSIPRELVESTLFGHERGAFTGAVEMRKGIFEEASGGTILLDEVGDMDLDLQRRLLRVLETRQITRVGSHRPIAVDVRIIAATNAELGAAINNGSFREDLYFRLVQVQVTLPPLRQRVEDIPGLAQRFMEEAAAWRQEGAASLAPETLQALRAHSWPGNVRELRNVVHRATSFCTGREVLPADLEIRRGGRAAPEDSVDLSLPFKEAKARVVERFARAYLTELMAATGGNLSHAAQRAGLARNHLRSLLRDHGLSGGTEEGAQGGGGRGER